MATTLVALAGPLRGEVFPLTAEGLTIGREPSNQLHLNDLALSRHHCRIDVDHDRVTVVDLESLNGTFVNGAAITQQLLEHGDHLRIGESVFVFLGQDATQLDQSAVEFSDAAPATTVTVPKQDLLGGDRLDAPSPSDLLRRWQGFGRGMEVKGPRAEGQELCGSTPRVARELQVLLRVSSALATFRNSEKLQTSLLDLLFEAVPAERAAILVSENDGADFTSVYARGRQAKEPVQISRTVVRQVMSDGVALLCNEPTTNEAFRGSESLIVTATRSVVCAPLAISDRRRGALYLASSDPIVRLDDGHLQLVAGIAALASIALQNVHHIERLEQETRELRADLALHHNMIGESTAIQKASQIIARAAPTDSTILILGESGTGKELAARAVHQNSGRARGPFVAITAAVLSESLLESELFGHEKGAFTGAIAQKKGQLELANGGTVFLDEIGDLAPGLQVKLLRVLQEREFTRVGGSRPVKIDVRFIAATHRDLEAAVKDGRFRQDLYYRLNVVRVRMPALRERCEDIPLLAKFFLHKFSAKCKRRVIGFSDEALALLARYDWPGNVRELENAVERAVVLGSAERILIDDLPENILVCAEGNSLPSDFHDAVRAAKQQIVMAALTGAGGNRAQAARQLRLHPNNLHRLIRNLGLKETLGS